MEDTPKVNIPMLYLLTGFWVMIRKFDFINGGEGGEIGKWRPFEKRKNGQGISESDPPNAVIYLTGGIWPVEA